ncbi:hypothetical protein HYX02_03035 [Candidatus Woesearchaeota archaeon]|nr:hypothetical protein [Candidatus Woesearchaeota archaeon]
MINITYLVLMILIILFAIFYSNLDKIKANFLSIFYSKRLKGKYVKICPKCGSTDTKTDFSNPVVWAYGTTVKYKCNSCWHLGVSFPEVLQNKINNYKKELNKKIKEGKHTYKREDLIDASTGFLAFINDFLGFLIGIMIIVVMGALYFVYKDIFTSIGLVTTGIFVILLMRGLLKSFTKS